MRAILLLVICTVLIAGCIEPTETTESPETLDTANTPSELETEASEIPSQIETTDENTDTYSGGETPSPPSGPSGSPGTADSSVEYEWSDSTPEVIAKNNSAQDYCSSDAVSSENYEEFCKTV
jgi:hypothetical protein